VAIPENAPRDGAPDRHVLIAAGGTAGHVVPALAVAEELRARGARVTFAGTAERIEAQLVPAAGHPFLTYRVTGLERRLSPALLRGIGLALVAPAACTRILRRTRPDAVFGAGGYVSGPMLAAAAAARLPAALLEVDARLGLANRLSAPLVRRVFLSFPIDGLEPPRYLVTGRPVPRSVLEATREQGRRELDLPPDRQVVLVFGGSLGARSVNFAAAEAWAAHDPGFAVVHVTGERDFPALAGRAAPHYRVLPFTTQLGSLLAASDLVVARAGGSVFEIAAAGRPAVLVPYPHATGDHQAANAAYVADGGAAVVLDDAELNPERLRSEVAGLLAEPRRLQGMGEAARRLVRADAARTIASELVRLAR
jgi:UDP-N-acetylglucosamine--N-acetylmuramyl-(pentapeptide) pyrophosphoryl-undecaprenol N-acetylglucosamine transferase